MRPSTMVRRVEDAASRAYEQVKVGFGNFRKDIEELVRDGNAKRVVVKNAEGEEIVSFRLLLGTVLFLTPILAAVGAYAALNSECSIFVERLKNEEEEKGENNPSTDVPPELL